MNLVWVMKKYFDEAVDRSVRIEMIRSLESQGHDVVLVSGYRRTRDDFGLGERLVLLESISVPYINHVLFRRAADRMVPRIVTDNSADAVILDAWTVGCASRIRAACERIGMTPPKVIMDVRTLPVQVTGLRKVASDRTFRSAMRDARILTDGVTCITSTMLHQLRTEWGLSDDVPTAVWSSGVSVQTFDPSRWSPEALARLRRKHGLGDDRIVLYHGSITRERGVHELVAAIALLPAELKRRTRLLLIGGGRDLGSILDEANRSEERDRFVHVPPVPYAEMPAYLALADVGVLPLPDLPGWRVSSPIKLLEYLAMGVPIVATDMIAHRDVLGDADYALYAGTGSASELADAIVRALGMPPEMRLRAASLERRLAVDTYTYDAQAAKLAGFIGGLT